jgi:hypothetical protein
MMRNLRWSPHGSTDGYRKVTDIMVMKLVVGRRPTEHEPALQARAAEVGAVAVGLAWRGGVLYRCARHAVDNAMDGSVRRSSSAINVTIVGRTMPSPESARGATRTIR